MGRVGGIAAKTETVMLIFFVCMIVVIVFFGVLARYTPLTGQTMWTAELARLFLLWASFWAAGSIERVGGHFRVDLIDNLFGTKFQLYLQLFTRLVILICVGILIQSTIEHSVSAIGKTTNVLQWPWVVRDVPLLFGCLLLFMHSLTHLIQNFRRLFQQC